MGREKNWHQLLRFRLRKSKTNQAVDRFPNIDIFENKLFQFSLQYLLTFVNVVKSLLSDRPAGPLSQKFRANKKWCRSDVQEIIQKVLRRKEFSHQSLFRTIVVILPNPLRPFIYLSSRIALKVRRYFQIL